MDERPAGIGLGGGGAIERGAGPLDHGIGIGFRRLGESGGRHLAGADLAHRLLPLGAVGANGVNLGEDVH